MPTLYVENVPADVYAALRKRAKVSGTSISAEVIDLLRQHVPTAKELARRRRLLEHALKIGARRGAHAGPTAEEMLREDRER
jgi:plasmid stability protein